MALHEQDQSLYRVLRHLSVLEPEEVTTVASAESRAASERQGAAADAGAGGSLRRVENENQKRSRTMMSQ